MSSRDARGWILNRIRGASGPDRRSPEPSLRKARRKGDGEMDLPRSYRQQGTGTPQERMNLFQERVSDYRASVSRCNRGSLPGTIAGILVRAGQHRLVIPADLPPEWLADLPDGALTLLEDGGTGNPEGCLPVGELADCEAVLTGCALAIAETGTIILDSGPGQGRRALSLLPDFHLCVVFEAQVVETVPEAIRALEPVVKTRGHPLTLISGPSATSDIELIRVEGVHGPRTLEVILVEGD